MYDTNFLFEKNDYLLLDACFYRFTVLTFIYKEMIQLATFHSL